MKKTKIMLASALGTVGTIGSLVPLTSCGSSEEITPTIIDNANITVTTSTIVKGKGFVITCKLEDGYEIDSDNIVISYDGKPLDSKWYTIDGNKIIVNKEANTDKIKISVFAKKTGEEKFEESNVTIISNLYDRYYSDSYTDLAAKYKTVTHNSDDYVYTTTGKKADLSDYIGTVEYLSLFIPTSTNNSSYIKISDQTADVYYMNSSDYDGYYHFYTGGPVQWTTTQDAFGMESLVDMIKQYLDLKLDDTTELRYYKGENGSLRVTMSKDTTDYVIFDLGQNAHITYIYAYDTIDLGIMGTLTKQDVHFNYSDKSLEDIYGSETAGTWAILDETSSSCPVLFDSAGDNKYAYIKVENINDTYEVLNLVVNNITISDSNGSYGSTYPYLNIDNPPTETYVDNSGTQYLDIQLVQMSQTSSIYLNKGDHVVFDMHYTLKNRTTGAIARYHTNINFTQQYDHNS